MPLKSVKQFFRREALRARGVEVQIRIAKRTPAKRESDWVIAQGALDADSVIYSFGVGDNIAFDLALIEQFEATVHAFDPTPRAIEWIRRQPLPDRFRFHAFGVGARDGQMRFFPPRRGTSLNFSPVDRGFDFGQKTTVDAPVKRIVTIMNELGHDRIDLLKIDIEGGEYDVIRDLIDSGATCRQLLVEYHHNFQAFSIEDTVQSIRLLNDAGYAVFDISKRGYEVSLLKQA